MFKRKYFTVANAVGSKSKEPLSEDLSARLLLLSVAYGD